MILRAFSLVLLGAAALACGLAHAQQYRWTDAQGRVHLTDTPPPAEAKNVRRIEGGGTQSAGQSDAQQPTPFEIARLQKDFPVTLYTTPSCKDLCDQARAVLNKRSVPFSEFQVWNDETQLKLKSATGSNQLPVLMVGRQMLRGFDQGQFDRLLDNAGYPAVGSYPERNQSAPPVPEGYAGPGAVAAKPPAAAKPAAGPYDTSGLQGPAPKPGQYDPSGLTGPPPKPGQYGVPGEAK